MRTIDLTRTIPADSGEWNARKIRHLTARLRELGEGRVRFLSSDPPGGLLRVTFPDLGTARVLRHLASRGVQVEERDAEAVFHLSSEASFEDLDYIWGCLDELCQ